MKKGRGGPTLAGKRRLLLVDDHPVVREGLARRINQESDLEVCGEAASASEARRAVARLHPDLVVLDLSLSDGLALNLIRDLTSLKPGILVLVFTMHDETVYAERALRAGARGYVMKQESPECLLAALRAVLRGDYSVSEKTEASFFRTFLNRPEAPVASSVARLTDRELEVFHLLGQGLATRETAARIGLSIKTIETYRARIMFKLHLNSAPELISFASRWLQSGLAGAPPPLGDLGKPRPRQADARRQRL